MLGKNMSLAQLQRGLRYSYLIWLVWILLVETGVKLLDLSLSAALGQSVIAALPLVCLLPVFWRGINGVMLIFASMLVMLYLGVAAMAMFKGTLAFALYGVESLCIAAVLFFAMWVIERLPKRAI